MGDLGRCTSQPHSQGALGSAEREGEEEGSSPSGWLSKAFEALMVEGCVQGRGNDQGFLERTGSAGVQEAGPVPWVVDGRGRGLTECQRALEAECGTSGQGLGRWP